MYTRPIKAAELMVENQGQFVCGSTGLKVGQRIQGVLADEELERSQFYFLLPMELLYSVLTQEELNSLTNKATKAVKHGNNNTTGYNNFGKIFPVLSEFCMFPPSEEKKSGSDIVVEPVERYSKQRSWKPALETIVETPCTRTRHR
ncbi:hypothetical protein HS088_TW20G00671 [Tripterygium wilfordii]|uniref:Uncharacterized protein n=2 Tax=Tripterygium wilfordii TaxID=458696 RepID=A0A7J7C837_TRIWF|nr:hypothetical protein HS088_TW20G00671 [Tripterygium wilfordii]